VNGTLIKQRAAALRAAGEAQVQHHLKSQIGKVHQVLMENPNMGRTAQFTEVSFDRPQQEGQIVAAQILDMRGTQLIA
jgi:threonylcarbamoyladenosine tRNA methylthiotransferase MtaB